MARNSGQLLDELVVWKTQLLGIQYEPFKKGEYTGAIREFQAVLKSMPESKNARQNLVAVYHRYGQTLDRQKRYGEAIHQLQQGLVLEPAHINLRLSLGYTYQHAGEFDLAKGAFEKVLEIAPDNLQAKEELVNVHIRRGNHLLSRKQYAAALTEFESIAQSRRDAGIYNTIGYLYLMKGQPIGALPAFEAALALDPMDDVAYQNLRSIESQFDRQLDRVNDSPAAKDGLARVRNSLVICLIGRKEHLKAKNKYRSAIDIASTDSEISAALIDTGLRLAKEFQQMNWPKNMTEVIRWVKERTPDDPVAKRLLEDTVR